MSIKSLQGRRTARETSLVCAVCQLQFLQTCDARVLSCIMARPVTPWSILARYSLMYIFIYQKWLTIAEQTHAK